MSSQRAPANAAISSIPGRSVFPIRKEAKTWRSFALPLRFLIRDKDVDIAWGR